MNYHKISNLVCKVKVTKLVKKIIPELGFKRKKGDNGVIGVIGGSPDYTGAPYYSAISALKSGSDLSHIFCHIQAANAIKCYSPELIVHPSYDKFKVMNYLVEDNSKWFDNMDSIVIGPGLGREVSEVFNNFFSFCSKITNLILIIDADGLRYLTKELMKSLVSEYPPKNEQILIITPNEREFEVLAKKHLCEATLKMERTSELIETFNMQDDILFLSNVHNDHIQKIFLREVELALRLNCIVVKKGIYDIITDGQTAYIIRNPGSLKRCGGLGDILDGIIVAFCSLIKKEKILINQKNVNKTDIMDAVAMACFVCRKAAENAYIKHGYSLTAPDVIIELAKLARNYSDSFKVEL